jgi:DNA repair protein RadC
MRHQRAEQPLKLDGPETAARFFAGCISESDPARESLWVAHVDARANCLHVSHYEGGETGAPFPLGAIITDAARHGSCGILLAHNHPSGDARPSTADCLATRRLAITADALGCRVIDHLIFAGEDCSSLRQLGFL